MNKMAIFVEGYTEVVFVDKLARLIAEKVSVDIRWHQYLGGTTCRQTCRQIHTPDKVQGHNHYIIIYDCKGDNAVKSRMMGEYDYLARSGYSKIVCVRDVYDKFKREEIKALQNGLTKGVKTQPIVVDFILSVMEVEAWFLAEHTHFTKIDPAITVEQIVNALGFNPQADDMKLRDHPAGDMHNCYQLAGKVYAKENAAETVAVLDCETIYYWAEEKFPDLRKLCTVIENFFKS